MLDIKFIRENPDKVREAAKNKNVNVDIDALLKLDAERRTLQAKIEEINRQRNEASKAKDIENGKRLKGELAALEERLTALDADMTPLMLKLPNVPVDGTPVGPDESGNVVIRTWGEPTKFAFKPKDHVELGKLHGIIDNELGAEVAGARFTYLKGDLVLLQQAIIQFVFSILTDKGALESIIAANKLSAPPTPFVPVIPPLMIKPEVFQRMARLEPREERYHIPSDDLFLIGSAEHTLGPMHMDETLDESCLPARYVACTAAFRREAGSYGKDTKGILRLHQFDKIEMESFSASEQSLAEQDLFVALQEHFLQAFGIPYQVVQICTGDMGGPDARQIDIESWMPGQMRYRETHTSDLMTDYQARRLGTRVKRRAGGSEFAHTNDATAIALGRTLIALIENHQREDGSIAIPEVLVPFMGGRTVIGSPRC
ncbi:MAG TPA: serine--tRNA ligase [Candidatus Eisenbacteria bacterium]|nr:serine--tRNA ligase [Candidatus Eisenbacteria bacterium]